MATRLTSDEARVIAQRIAVEGWCDMGYDDEFEQNAYGFRVNIGRVRIENKLRGTAKNRLGLKVRAKSFPIKDDSWGGGGVVVVALPEKADEVFGQYGEGFYGG